MNKEDLYLYPETDKKDLYKNPEPIDNITPYGKDLEPRIDPRTDYGKGISYKNQEKNNLTKSEIIQKFQKDFLEGKKEEFEKFLEKNPILKRKLALDEYKNIVIEIGKNLEGLPEPLRSAKLFEWYDLASTIVESCYTDRPYYAEYEEYKSSLPIPPKR